MSRILRFLFPTTRYTGTGFALPAGPCGCSSACCCCRTASRKSTISPRCPKSSPTRWGWAARISLTLAIFGELFCSVGFIVGAFYRLALIPMIFTMCVALFVVHGNDPFAVKELAAIYLSVFVLMYISGPGNYALDRLIADRLRN